MCFDTLLRRTRRPPIIFYRAPAAIATLYSIRLYVRAKSGSIIYKTSYEMSFTV